METALTGTLSLVPSYVYWHYVKAAKHIWRLAANFGWFFWHFFSIGLLTRTFFKPWWREADANRLSAQVLFSGEAFGMYIATKVTNGVVFVFGIIVRSAVIVVGLLAEALLWISALIFFIAWLVVPVIVAYLVFAGIVFTLRPL